MGNKLVDSLVGFGVPLALAQDLADPSRSRNLENHQEEHSAMGDVPRVVRDPVTGGISLSGGISLARTNGSAAPDYSISEARLETSGAWLSGPATNSSWCTIPTHLANSAGPTGSGTGAVVEPSMLYFPEGWNGWEYWLCVMPYDGGNAQYENPSIVVSHDGYTWFEPTGISNPLSYPPNATDHNFDSTIFMLEDNQTMAIVWGQTSGLGANSGLYFITSTNGINWTSPSPLVGTFFPVGTHYLQAPCPIFDRAVKQWTLYSLDYTGSVMVPVYQTATAVSGPWSAPVSLTINYPPPETQIWHWELKKLSSGVVAGVANCGTASGGSVYPIKFPVTSAGALGTTAYFGPILRSSNFLQSSHLLYRAAFIPFADHWKVLFGTLSSGPQTFNMTPGIVRFDRTAYQNSLNGIKAGLMSNALLTGTLGSFPFQSNGLAWDSFNHATFGNLTASGNGSATAWTQNSGVFTITANALGQTSAGIATIATGQSDVDIRATCISWATSGVLVFRLQNTNNFWRVMFYAGVLLLQSVSGGTATTQQSCAVTTSEGNSEIAVSCKGNNIKVFWQGIQVCEVNSTYLNTQTNHGLQIVADTTTWSNFLVYKN